MLNEENRSYWEFEYSTKELAKAAAAKRDFHAGRVDVWKDQKNKKLQEIKDTGIEVEDSVTEDMGYGGMSNMSASIATRSHRGPMITIDQKLQRDLNEIQGKIHTHQELTKDYAGWQEIFEGAPEARVKLKAADWLYFFSKPELMTQAEQ